MVSKWVRYCGTVLLVLNIVIIVVSGQSPLQPVTAAVGTSGGSPVSYGGFGGFQGSFLYEPFGRHQSQLFIGCYQIGKFDFNSPQNLYLQFSLIAKKDAPIQFQDCWQFCMFKNPRKRDWFKPNYIGMLPDSSKCMCFDRLLQRFTNVPIPSCSSPCTGIQGEACKDNTMQVYVTCYPGFYRPPYCDAQCPFVKCQPNEYPNSQFQNFFSTACSTVEGNCIKGCANGTACPTYTPICSFLGGQQDFEASPMSWMDPAYFDSATIIGLPRRAYFEQYIFQEKSRVYGRDVRHSCDNMDHFTYKKVPTIQSNNTQVQAWISKIITSNTEVGYGKLYMLTNRKNVDTRVMQAQVVAVMELKDLGFAKAYAYTFYVGDVNENGEQLLTIGDQNAWFAFGTDPQARTKYDCHIYNFQNYDPFHGSLWAYTEFSRGVVYKAGDLVTAVYVEPGSSAFDENLHNQNLQAEILMSIVYVCSSACAQKACDCQGHCLFGCSAGYMDPTCSTRCPTGIFGMWCRYPCSPYCKNQICDPENGVCLLGCSYTGLKGAYCTEVCEAGTYGDNCLQQCNPQCVNPLQCSYLDGTCQNGCKAGYNGAQCNTPCVAGTYGANCSTPCGNCKNNAACDRFTGACPAGCDGGKIPPMCQCTRGFYGDKCQYNCGVCVDGLVCDATDGCCTTNPEILVSQGQKTVVVIISKSNDTFTDIYTMYTNVSTTPLPTVSTPNTVNTTRPAAVGAKLVAPLANTLDPTADTTDSPDLGPEALLASTWGPQLGITGWFAQAGQGGGLVYNVSNQTPGGARVIITITPDRPTFTYNNVTVYVPADNELANMAVNDVGLRETLRKLLFNINLTASTGMVSCGDIPPNPSRCMDPTFQSPSCVCLSGFYGQGCQSMCGYCAGVNCKNSDGYCFGGCKPGYLPNYCINKCPTGFYGDCITACGRCLGNVTCNNENGQCSTGCVKGYKPPMCQGCADLYFGVNCSKNCGSCLAGAMCNFTTGYCDTGCAVGYEAPFCWCYSGFWGSEDCNKKCGYCNGSTGCDPRNGKCLYGCSAGYTTEWCNKTCPAGYYGNNCAISCGSCFNRSICDPVTGVCPNGCDGNLRPPKCICPKGTFTDTCKPCGNCVNGTQCDANTGECKTGCQLGHRPPMCVCRSLTWGSDCSKKCGQCTDNVDCDIATGICQSDCAIGYIGKMCLELCKPGLTGKNCSKKCGQCANCQPCDPITAFCVQGCKPGYFPPTCLRECPDQTFGPLCKDLCGRCINAEACRKSDGKCLNGCMKGWSPPTCIDACTLGFYGANCLSRCGKCDMGDDCNKVDGTCPRGCQNGYVPPFCTDLVTSTKGAKVMICDKNYYGSNCQLPCGHCHNDQCDQMSGLCLEGCKPGYHPLQCRVECSNGWYGLNCANKCGHCFNRLEICRHTDGLCSTGCQRNWFGLDCNFGSYDEFKASLAAIGSKLSGANNIEVYRILNLLPFFLAFTVHQH